MRRHVRFAVCPTLWRVLAGMVLVPLWAGMARADGANGVELVFGATNIRAVSGDGRTTLAVAPDGTWTVLKWPGPSVFDHLDYRTSNAANARVLPYLGAAPSQGAFDGVDPGDGMAPKPWREAPWQTLVRYDGTDNDLVVVEHSHPAGHVASCTTAAVDEGDVLVHRCDVSLAAGAGADHPPRYFFYLNPALSDEFTPFEPTGAFERDGEHGFGLFYAPDQGVLVVALPRKVATARADLDAVARGELSAGALTANLDARWDPRVVLAATFDPPLDGWVCGQDPARAGVPSPADAFAAIGALASVQAPAGPCASGPFENFLGVVTLPPDGRVEVYAAIRDNVADALDAVVTACRQGGQALLDAERQADAAWLAAAELHDLEGEARAFAERTLLTIRSSRAADMHHQVASVAVQPPYGLDWPRDGAFIDYLLEVAGRADLVTPHALYYASVQRSAAGQDARRVPLAPAGSWAMNTYPDGTPGGPIDFEIDQVGLALWLLADHLRWLPAGERPTYWQQVRPAVVRAADLLVSCVDPAGSGLPCPASEDDHFEATMGLQGATSALAGLRAAVHAAHAAGEPAGVWTPWQERAKALEAAIDAVFLAPERLVGNPPDLGALAWHIWPTGALTPAHPSFEVAANLLADSLQRGLLDDPPAGGAYHAKAIVALLAALAPGHPARAVASEALDVLVEEVATPHTRHLGEAYAPGPDGVWQDYTAIPHVWEATLVTLALLARDAPGSLAGPPWPPRGSASPSAPPQGADALDTDDVRGPSDAAAAPAASGVSDRSEPGSSARSGSDGGCRAAGGSGPSTVPAWLVAAAAALALVRRARYQRACHGGVRLHRYDGSRPSPGGRGRSAAPRRRPRVAVRIAARSWHRTPARR